MHRACRERNVDAVGIKRLFDRLGQVEFDWPQIRVVDPDPDGEVHRTVRHRGHADERSGIRFNSRVGRDGFMNNRHHLIDIRVVGDPHGDIHAASRVGGVVADRRTPNLPVGHGDLDIIGRCHDGEEQIELLDRPRMFPGFDVVTGSKWPKKKQHHPRSNVRQCALKGESNGEAGCCEHYHKARRLDTELIEDSNSDDSEKRLAKN